MGEMRDRLRGLNARVIHEDGEVEAVFDRAWRTLRMRRILVRVAEGYAILPVNRPLVTYYANSIAHLLAPFFETVGGGDSLRDLGLMRGK